MKRIKYVVYGFSGIFILGLVFLIFAFSHSSIREFSRGKMKTEIQKLKSLETEFIQQKKAYRDWQQVEKAFDRFKSDYLFPFSTFSEFRSRFESLLRKNRMNTSRLGYDIKNVNRQIVRVSIGFETEGRYQNLKKMVYEIDQMKQVIFIEGMKIVKSASGIKADINVEVYFAR